MSKPDDLREQILVLVRQYYETKFEEKTFDPSRDRVHYAGRVFDGRELCYLVDASLDFYLTANRYAEQFEADFAERLGMGNALLVNSPGSAGRNPSIDASTPSSILTTARLPWH